METAGSRRILISGGPGGIASAFSSVCSQCDLEPVLIARYGFEAVPLGERIAESRACAAIDVSGLESAAAAKRYPGGTFVANARRAECFAQACTATGLPLLAFSSDLVFDGRRDRAARESDPVHPHGLYGVSAVDMERRVRGAHPSVLLVRTGALFGEPDRKGLADRIPASVAAGLPLPLRPNEIISPTYLPDLADAALHLLIGGETGVWHLVNSGETTWADFANDLLTAANLLPSHTVERLTVPERNTALASERAEMMPTIESAIARYLGTAALRQTVQSHAVT